MATDQPPALIIGLVVLLTLASGAAGLLFYYRGFAVTGAARRLWLMLASLLGGGVGWTAHYGCVLVLLPLTQAYAFAPWAMLLSLVLDASCLMVSIRAAQTVGPRWNVVVMALTLSAIISVSNYISIRSIRVPGELSIDLSTLWLGFLACFALSHAGAILVARLRGVGKSAAGALLLALGSPAFDLIVLGGMDLRLDPAAAAPQGLAPSEMLAGLVLGLGVLLTSVTVASVYVDKQIDAVANARYREMALTDPLTGAPSRAAMTERLHDLFQNLEGNAASGDAARSVAVLAIDLNRFKPINDVHGHAAGDALLAAISERCIAVLKDGETFGRMGGDEFLALKSPLGSDAEINAFARRLIAEIERPVQHGGVTLSVGVSIGWCRAPEHATEPAAALNRADLALYRAKTRGQ
ncbi:MAG: GGDEF domain-containing protein, partial [Pseudomonadota bacterium]